MLSRSHWQDCCVRGSHSVHCRPLTHGNGLVMVDLVCAESQWSVTKTKSVTGMTETSVSVTECNLVSVATWNCRGFNNSKPYNTDLIKFGLARILVMAIRVVNLELSDKRLHACSNLVRGCGGIAILGIRHSHVFQFQFLIVVEFVGFAC